MQTLFGTAKFGTQVFGEELQPFVENKISYNYLSSFTFTLAKYGQILFGTKRFGQTFELIPEITKNIIYQITQNLSSERQIIYSFDILYSEENQIIYDFFSKLATEKDIVYDYTLVSAFERDIKYYFPLVLPVEKTVVYDFSSVLGKEFFIVYSFIGTTLKGVVRNIRFDVSTGQLVAIVELERM